MRRTDLVNLVSLIGIQVSSAALPLVVFPHLLSVVGPDLYAKVVLSEAIAIVVLTAVLYSFDVDAMARVVGLDIHADREKISHAFSAILYARLFIFVVCAAMVFASALFIDATLASLLAWWLLWPLSYVVQSLWLFQGLERNAPVATFTVLSRLVCMVLALVWVQQPADHGLVPMLIGLLFMTGGTLSLTYAFVVYGLRLRRVPLAEVVRLLRDGRSVFLGNASVLLYRDLNVVILGVAGAGAQAISLYSLAEKLVKGLQASMRPLNQLFFPKAVRAIKGMSRADPISRHAILRLTAPQLMIMAALVAGILTVYLLGEEKVPALHDMPNRQGIALLVMVMLPAIFVGVANFMFGTIGLNHLSQRWYFFRCLLTAGVVNIVVCYAFATLLGSTGAAISFVLSELLLATLVLAAYRQDPRHQAA